MYIYINHIKHQLALRKHEPLYKNEIGSILKDLRKKHQLTLEEGAQGICSVSYLSKIENNQMAPTTKYIELFEEKYKFNMNSLNSRYKQELIEELINVFYQHDEFSQYEILDGNDYQSKLINYTILVGNNDFTKAKTLFKDVNNYLKNFSDKELLLYLFLTSKVLSNEGRYKDAFNTLNLFTSREENLKLDIIMMKEKIMISSIINNHAYMMLNYEKFIQKLAIIENYAAIHDLKFMYLTYFSQFINFESLEKDINNHQNLSKKEKDYLFIRHHYLNMNYEKAYKLIMGKERINKSFYILALMIANKLKHKEDVMDLIKNEYQGLNHNEKLVVDFLKIKYQKNSDLITFIREQILKTNDIPDHQDLINFWYEEGINCLKENNYYKEASILSQLIVRKMKNLSTYID